MFLISKNSRKDVKDISDDKILLIKNKEVLLVELEHANKILQDKEKVVNTLTILFLSALGILTWNLLKGIIVLFNTSENIKLEDLEHLQNDAPIFINIGFFIIFSAIIFFIFLVIADLRNRGKIIDRKNLILQEIRKVERVRRYNKS